MANAVSVNVGLAVGKVGRTDTAGCALQIGLDKLSLEATALHQQFLPRREVNVCPGVAAVAARRRLKEMVRPTARVGGGEAQGERDSLLGQVALRV
jgi:hypothetical protein